MTDAYFKTPFATKTKTIFYMKKIFKSFLTYSLLPDHQKTCRACNCKFPHSGAKLNVKAMFLCTGAALESLKWSRFYSCSAAISSCTQSWTTEILELSVRPLHIHGTENYLRFKWTCRLWALLSAISLYSHTDHQSAGISHCRSALSRFCVSRLVSPARRLCFQFSDYSAQVKRPEAES